VILENIPIKVQAILYIKVKPSKIKRPRKFEWQSLAQKQAQINKR